MKSKKPASPQSHEECCGDPSSHNAAPQPSPLPWKVREYTAIAAFIETVPTGGPIPVAQWVSPKDAALIVRRVNQGPAFDALLKAAEFQQAADEGEPWAIEEVETMLTDNEGRDYRTQTQLFLFLRRAALKLAQEVI